jgi:hypothetical protein
LIQAGDTVFRTAHMAPSFHPTPGDRVMSTTTQTPSTAAPNGAQPAAPSRPTPILDYRDLRRLAEYASGVRECDEPVWLAAFGNGVIQRIDDPAAYPRSTDALVVATRVGAGRGNCDTTRFARIGNEPGEKKSVDLLKIYYRGEPTAADSVFWSQSAVEKFMVPYYASVYAGEAADKIKAILGLLGSPQQIRLPSGEIEDTPYEVFALIHLPQSEYVDATTQPSELPTDLAVGLRAPDGTHRAVHVLDLV